MKKLLLIALLIMGCEKETPNMELSQHLKPLQQYIGKTFKGEFANSTPENPTYDVHHWERALNGNANNYSLCK